MSETADLVRLVRRVHALGGCMRRTAAPHTSPSGRVTMGARWDVELTEHQVQLRVVFFPEPPTVRYAIRATKRHCTDRHLTPRWVSEVDALLDDLTLCPLQRRLAEDPEFAALYAEAEMETALAWGVYTQPDLFGGPDQHLTRR